ncbi:helix-turn-helix domain-containing protein [Chondrinema litorale]|uniref:helix-turn-helix domain-containing protein n=1 Tax=Chondrinema litorale TaxID=2994555 RepID=UPI002543D204|nr:AraC family transcriptional regulator [Chondrinema litorale]UZR96770.1 AraC family transcriptional regulator [Chondrinema litorale]
MIAILLYALPSGRKKQNLPLCFFLLLTALHSLTDLTIDSPLFGSAKIHLVVGPFIFLYAPLLYFHYCRLFDVEIKKVESHFAIFGIFLVYHLLWGFSHTIFFAVFSMQYLYYSIWIGRLVKIRQKEKPIKRIWILFITYSFGLVWLFAISANVFSQLNYEPLASWTELIAYISAVILFCGFIYFTMSQPSLFMQVRVAVSNQIRYEESTDRRVKKQMLTLTELLTKEKIFSDPELNREILAQKLGMDVQQLSKEINQHFKMNLSELINQYRISEAKILLQNQELNIKEIYYKTGFQSRSAFNNAFKKQTEKTPSEYRKTL